MPCRVEAYGRMFKVYVQRDNRVIQNKALRAIANVLWYVKDSIFHRYSQVKMGNKAIIEKTTNEYENNLPREALRKRAFIDELNPD